MISKLKLPQATMCAALECWFATLDKDHYRGAKCISVRIKSVVNGEFEAYVELPVRPRVKKTSSVEI